MSVVTRNRRFTLPTHGAVELVLGLATLTAPFLLSFGNVGIVVGVLCGSVLVGMAVSAGAGVRGSLGWHHLFDLVFVLATAVAALGLALAGEAPAGLFFAGLTVLHSGLNVATRYVAPA
jgi:hypothetical protein